MGGTCSTHKVIKCISALIETPERKRQLRRSRRKWNGNIKMDTEQIGYEWWAGFIWLKAVKLQNLLNTTMNLRVPQNVGNFLAS
jgi:hypothetical protein